MAFDAVIMITSPQPSQEVQFMLLPLKDWKKRWIKLSSITLKPLEDEFTKCLFYLRTHLDSTSSIESASNVRIYEEVVKRSAFSQLTEHLLIPVEPRTLNSLRDPFCFLLQEH